MNIHMPYKQQISWNGPVNTNFVYTMQIKWFIRFRNHPLLVHILSYIISSYIGKIKIWLIRWPGLSWAFSAAACSFPLLLYMAPCLILVPLKMSTGTTRSVTAPRRPIVVYLHRVMRKMHCSSFFFRMSRKIGISWPVPNRQICMSRFVPVWEMYCRMCLSVMWTICWWSNGFRRLPIYEIRFHLDLQGIRWSLLSYSSWHAMRA